MCHNGPSGGKERQGWKCVAYWPCKLSKTFLLNILTQTLDAFCNPATGAFAWVGVEEIIFLYDFRSEKAQFHGQIWCYY